MPQKPGPKPGSHRKPKPAQQHAPEKVPASPKPVEPAAPAPADPRPKPSENPLVSPVSSASNAPKGNLLAEIASRHAPTVHTGKGKPGPKPGSHRNDPRPGEKSKKVDAETDPELQEIGADAVAEAEIGFFSAVFGETFESGHYGTDDRKILKSGWKYYFRINGMPALPGWLVLIMVHMAYLGARIGRKENRDALKGSFGRIWGKVFGGKSAARPKETQPATQRPQYAAPAPKPAVFGEAVQFPVPQPEGAAPGVPFVDPLPRLAEPIVVDIPGQTAPPAGV